MDQGREHLGCLAGDARWCLVTDAVSVVGQPGDFDVAVAYVCELSGQGRNQAGASGVESML